ncbi:MAG: YhcB family protein [Candidatus Binatia bacterium]
MEIQIAPWMWTAWIAAVAIFLIGLLAGMALSRPRKGQGATQRVKELESELHQSREEFAKYRDQVTQHFLQTADLLHAMTANYRAVYEHLADGAQNLCAGQVKVLSPAALRERILPENSSEAPPAEQHGSPNSLHAETAADQDSPQPKVDS